MRLRALLLRLSRPDVAWNLTDQAAAAASNILANVLVGRGGGARALGVFAIVFAVYIGLLGVTRTFFGEPLLVSRTHDESFESSLCALSGLWCGALGLTAGIVVMPFYRTAPLVGLLVAGAAWQDFMRFSAFARRNPRVAAESDALWVVVVAVAVPVVMSRYGSGAAGAAAWAAGGTAGGLWALFRLRLRPALRERHWRAQAWPYARYLAIDSLGYHANAQLVVAAIASQQGVTSAGYFRGAQLLLSPGNLLLSAAMMAVTPRLATASREDDLTPYLRLIAVGGIATAVVMGVLGPALLVAVLGREFDVTRDLAWPVAVGFALIACGTPLVMRLKARRRSGLLAVVRIVTISVGAPILWFTASSGSLIAFQWAVTGEWGVYLVAAAVAERHARAAS